MSYVGPGSIYSIGLHNIAMMCFLLSVASTISVAAFWGRMQGKIGSLGDSLAATLFKVRSLRMGTKCLYVRFRVFGLVGVSWLVWGWWFWHGWACVIVSVDVPLMFLVSGFGLGVGVRVVCASGKRN